MACERQGFNRNGVLAVLSHGSWSVIDRTMILSLPSVYRRVVMRRLSWVKFFQNWPDQNNDYCK
jgi:hypothetical protein